MGGKNERKQGAEMNSFKRENRELPLGPVWLMNSVAESFMPNHFHGIIYINNDRGGG